MKKIPLIITILSFFWTVGFGQYATGTYFLELRDGKRLLKTFKIVRSL